jgi:hypothetical protein
MAGGAPDLTPWIRIAPDGSRLLEPHRDWPSLEGIAAATVLIAFDETPRPSIYVGLKTLSDLQSLVEMFVHALTGVGTSVQLAAPEFAVRDNIDSLSLVHADRDSVSFVRTAAGFVCQWEITRKNLQTAIAMLVTLGIHGGPAHQYLAEDQSNVEIEVDYIGSSGNVVVPGTAP